MTLSCLQLKIPNIVSEGQSLTSLITSPHLQKFPPRFHCTTATTKTVELQSFLYQKLLVSQHKYPFLPPDELTSIQSQRQRQTIFAKHMFSNFLLLSQSYTQQRNDVKTTCRKISFDASSPHIHKLSVFSTCFHAIDK